MSNQITMVFGAKAVKATISTSAVIGSNDNGFRYGRLKWKISLRICDILEGIGDILEPFFKEFSRLRLF